MRLTWMPAAAAACLLAGSLAFAQSPTATPTITVRGMEAPTGHSRSIRSGEWEVISQLKVTSEEWLCRGRGAEPEQTLRFETRMTNSATTRVFLDGRELDAAPLNEVMKGITPPDLVRIDVTTCATEFFIKEPYHTVVIHLMLFPGHHTEPVAEFHITRDGAITLAKLY